MKRWAEFERDRRYRAGSHSRDSTYDVIQRSTSPHRSSSPRDSTISSIDTYASNGGGGVAGEALLWRSSPAISNSPSQSAEGGYPGHRYPAQIELPAPLGGQALNSESSSLTRDEGSALDLSDPNQPGFQRQFASGHDYPRYAEGYDSDELERQAILPDSPIIVQQSPPLPSTSSFSYPRPEREHPASYQDSISPSTSSGPSGRPGPSPAPTTASDSPFISKKLAARKARGVSLVDDGPVPGSEGMRTVQRQQRRMSQGPPPSSHRSRHSIQSDLNSHTSPTSPTSGSLPPGAAPPRTSHSAARD